MKFKKPNKLFLFENAVVVLALVGQIFYPPKSMVYNISMAGIGAYLLAQVGMRIRRMVTKMAETPDPADD